MNPFRRRLGNRGSGTGAAEQAVDGRAGEQRGHGQIGE
jgi:hypothetical protein